MRSIRLRDLCRGDCVTILTFYKTMHENTSKIAVNARCRKYFQS